MLRADMETHRFGRRWWHARRYRNDGRNKMMDIWEKREQWNAKGFLFNLVPDQYCWRLIFSVYLLTMKNLGSISTLNFNPPELIICRSYSQSQRRVHVQILIYLLRLLTIGRKAYLLAQEVLCANLKQVYLSKPLGGLWMKIIQRNYLPHNTQARKAMFEVGATFNGFPLVLFYFVFHSFSQVA